MSSTLLKIVPSKMCELKIEREKSQLYLYSVSTGGFKNTENIISAYFLDFELITDVIVYVCIILLSLSF